jgi:hypothetical protein
LFSFIYFGQAYVLKYFLEVFSFVLSITKEIMLSVFKFGSSSFQYKKVVVPGKDNNNLALEAATWHN